jgi:hypothetical protein
MVEAKLLLLLCQKLVRKSKKQDGKQNKRYDINSYLLKPCQWERVPMVQRSVDHQRKKRKKVKSNGKVTSRKIV